MIEALSIVLGGGLTGSLITIVYLAVKYAGAKDEVVVAAKALTDTQRVSDQYAEQRDEYVTQLAAARAQIVTLQDRLTEAAKERDAAFQKGKEDVVSQLQKAPIADAAKYLGDLLQRPILEGQAGTAGASGDGAAARPVSAAPAAVDHPAPSRLPGS